MPGACTLPQSRRLDSLLASGAVAGFATSAGALVVAPVVVLWAVGGFRPFDPDKVLSSERRHRRGDAVGLIAFSPLFEQSAARTALAFLAAAAVAVVARLPAGTSATPRPACSFYRALRSGER